MTDVVERAPAGDTTDPATDERMPRGGARRHARRALLAQRGALYRVHRWSSLLLGAWILLESLTGAAIVFGPEIDRWWNSEQFRATSGDVGVDGAIGAARDARPGEPIDSVIGPGDGGPMYTVYTVDQEGEFRTVLVDPGSGDVTSTDHAPPELVHLLEELHFDLNSTSIVGFHATTVVGWLAVGSLVVLLIGFTVWYWPRVKRWARALRVRRGRGRLVFNVELHNAIGVAVMLPLTLIVLTGINLVFPQQVQGVYEIVTFGLYEEADTTAALSEPTGGDPIGAGAAAAIVEDLHPSIDSHYVETPAGSPVGVYSVGADVDPSFLGMVGGEHEVEFEVDQYSGRIVRISDSLDDNAVTQAYDHWSYPVHTGTFGGTVTRVLWLVIGLTPVALAWTGVVIWWTRRRKRAATPTPPDTTSIDRKEDTRV